MMIISKITPNICEHSYRIQCFDMLYNFTLIELNLIKYLLLQFYN